MRWSLAVLLVLAGCGSDAAAPAASDAGEKTCARTACVKGASCITPGDVQCVCVETGVWQCGDVPPPGRDGGLGFDVGEPTPPDTAPPSDASSSYSYDLTGCGTKEGCGGGEDPVASARSLLTDMLFECRVYCKRLTLQVAPDGCPVRMTFNTGLTATMVGCLEKHITDHRWSCAGELTIPGPCPD